MSILYNRKIEYEMCDTQAKLSLPYLCKMVSSAVAYFFKLYEKDNLSLARNYQALWLFTKAKYEIASLPSWEDEVLVEAYRCKTNSKLTCRIGVFIHKQDCQEGCKAWVECCSVCASQRKLLRLDAIDFNIPMVENELFDFAKWEFKGTYQHSIKVCASQIDYSQHTNNTEYVRMIYDSFSIKELENLRIKTMELHFLKESREQDVLDIFCEKTPHEYKFQITRNEPVFEMKMEVE